MLFVKIDEWKLDALGLSASSAQSIILGGASVGFSLQSAPAVTAVRTRSIGRGSRGRRDDYEPNIMIRVSGRY